VRALARLPVIMFAVSRPAHSLHRTLDVRSTTESDWPELRAFRLENASEHPISYGATLETTLTFDEEAWRMRARRGDQEDTASYVVLHRETGRWVGMMACQLGDDDGPEPVLTGVYVTPSFRGARFGIADTLLERIRSWAAPQSALLRLWVYDGSEPARRFYRRHGFADTGRSRATDLPPDGRLLEMAVRLH
jgi:GNAT superfamily N-acetyltransferase